MDAGYGPHSDLRTAVTALGSPYVAGVLSNTTVWAPGTGPLPAQGLDAGSRSTDQAPAPRCPASAGLYQRSCVQPSGQSMANDHVAGGNQRSAQIALCAPAYTYRQARL